MAKPDRDLTIEKVSEICGKTRRTLHRWMKRGVWNHVETIDTPFGTFSEGTMQIVTAFLTSWMTDENWGMPTGMAVDLASRIPLALVEGREDEEKGVAPFLFLYHGGEFCYGLLVKDPTTEKAPLYFPIPSSTARVEVLPLVKFTIAVEKIYQKDKAEKLSKEILTDLANLCRKAG